jgi:site-specific DNA recombinase
MKIRTYTRRSKSDNGKQEYSLDVQDAGCRDWRLASPFAATKVVPYVDDGIAGDDFLHRDDLRRLLSEAKPGDIVVCRDQSRLGRDALEATIVVRDIVRDRGCRLFYYANGQEVFFETAIDAAMTFITGTGHQMELEAIRSRVKEALRMRARAGRVAGGRCYGYRLERVADGSGRGFTIAVIDEKQAEVVRRIFTWRCEGWGLKRIAHELNSEGVPSPRAGKRGTGSWAPSCVRSMLMNPRYRGSYVHGKIKKVRKGGVVARVHADAGDVITLDVPEWRIVDDAIWTKAQAAFAPRQERPRAQHPRAKYPLTGIARCGECDGAIGVANGRRNGRTQRSYACSNHHNRGAAVCPVTIYQPMEEIERAMVAYIDQHVLTSDVVASLAGEIRAGIEAQLPSRKADVAALEEELRNVRAEQKRLTKAVAMADDVPELVTELRERATRAKNLEVRLGAIRTAPDELRAMIDQAEAKVRERLGNIRTTLHDGSDLRQTFLKMFPDGIRFVPARVGDRQLWKIVGEVSIGQLVTGPEDPWFSMSGDPNGI